jgi:nucleotide-binding universal stress UspA family protein
MKSILIPFSGGDASRIALDTALLIGRQFGSYIEGLFVYQVPPIIAGEGITLPGDYMTQLGEENRALARKAREAFDQALSQREIPAGSVQDGDGVCAGWTETEATLSQAIGEYGRVFDLIVVARDSQPTVDWKAACETAMFETGRPVMVVGDAVPERLGRKILVS